MPSERPRASHPSERPTRFIEGAERRDLAELIDESHAPDKSILLRYWPVLDKLRMRMPIDRATLEASSRSEGAHIVPLATYHGVDILLCDESSLMETGTYKDLDACIIRALLTQVGVRRVTVSSGANLGYALSRYLSNTDVELYFFHPKTTSYKFDAANFDARGVRLISVDLGEREVKSLANAFAKHYGIMLAPDIRWRLAASAFRAMFILESLRKLGANVDFLAQTMCAGFGPAGIYNCFSELAREGYAIGPVPRFIGFQQEANAPMVRAWRAGAREIGRIHVGAEPSLYMEPVLYNTDPERNYTRVFDLLSYFGGDLLSIGVKDWERYSGTLLSWFEKLGMRLTRAGDQILEKTGLLTGVGILKAIDSEAIPAGSTVLYLLTGGFRRLPSSWQPAQPNAKVDGSRTEEEWIRVLGERFGLVSPPYKRASDILFG